MTGAGAGVGLLAEVLLLAIIGEGDDLAFAARHRASSSEVVPIALKQLERNSVVSLHGTGTHELCALTS